MTTTMTHAEKAITIYVNTKPHTVIKDLISFTDVVKLAYDGNPPTGPDWSFTVSYHRGQGDKPEGTLREGGSVRVKDGMLFDVTATNKS